jgi:hypothetical protein
LPKFVENWKKRYKQFDITSIPALESGCMFWAIQNRRMLLDSVKKIVESVPELKESWGNKVEAAFEMEKLSSQIQEYVREHPGTIQSQLKHILCKPANDVSLVAYYLNKFGMIKRVKSGSSYSLFISNDSQKIDMPLANDLPDGKHTATSQKRRPRTKKADVDVISDFYVYVHRDPKTGIPFYVGKGRGKRAYDRTSRDKEWHDFVESIGGKFEVEIVKKNLTEMDAYEIEADLIAQYGKRRDGAGSLINWTDGGEGEIGNLSFSVEIPWLKEASEKAYEETVCRVLIGEERDRFTEKLSKILSSLLDDLEDIYGEEDEYDCLESTLQSLEEDTFKFSKRRISSKDITFSIDEEIESLQSLMEDADILRDELKSILTKAIKELQEIRSELKPK